MKNWVKMVKDANKDAKPSAHIISWLFKLFKRSLTVWLGISLFLLNVKCRAEHLLLVLQKSF